MSSNSLTTMLWVRLTRSSPHLKMAPTHSTNQSC